MNKYINWAGAKVSQLAVQLISRREPLPLSSPSRALRKRIRKRSWASAFHPNPADYFSVWRTMIVAISEGQLRFEPAWLVASSLTHPVHQPSRPVTHLR